MRSLSIAAFPSHGWPYMHFKHFAFSLLMWVFLAIHPCFIQFVELVNTLVSWCGWRWNPWTTPTYFGKNTITGITPYILWEKAKNGGYIANEGSTSNYGDQNNKIGGMGNFMMASGKWTPPFCDLLWYEKLHPTSWRVILGFSYSSFDVSKILS